MLIVGVINMIEQLSNYFLIFIIYSFIGWAMEVVLTIIQTGKFVNRGFLIGPYCPIYGFGSLLITGLLKEYFDNFIVLFILAMVICMVLEYITSYLMEKLFKARWWDYSDLKFNINGRICLETAVPFGIGALLITYVIHPLVLELIGFMGNTTSLIVSICIFILFLTDNIISFNIISKLKDTGIKIRKDSTEEITKKIKEYLLEQSRLTKRLVYAFPNFQASINSIKLKQKELRRELKEKEQLLKYEIEEKEFNLEKDLENKKEKLEKAMRSKKEKLERKIKKSKDK